LRARWMFPVLIGVFILLPAGKAAAASSQAGFELQDAAGRIRRFDRLPRRILAVGHGPQMLAHLLFMFPESRERLIGWERRGSTPSEFIPLIDPHFGSREYPGPNPGIEQIAALHPDVVLMRGMAADPKGEALEKVGIPVVYLGLETPERFEADIILAGRLLGNPSRAEEVMSFYRQRLDRVDRGLKGISEMEKPSVLVAMAIARGREIAVEVPALSWMQTIQVRRAGGKPVWADAAAGSSGWTVVNMEQIARWNADKVILVVWYKLDPRGTIDRFKSDPLWKSLRAVRKGDLRVFPSDLYGWDTPDPRWILGLTWLARTLHPDRFKDLDLAAEVKAFYGRLYGMSEAEVASKILPTVRLEER